MSQSKWNPKSTKGTEWNNKKNWQPSEVPTEKAEFSTSKVTGVTFNLEEQAQIDTIEFDSNADAFTFTIGNSPENTSLTISGDGVVNNSNNTQSFVVASDGKNYSSPQLKFAGKASAGGENVSYKAGPTSLEEGFGGGIIGFTDESTAGSASFVARTGAVHPPDYNSTVGAEIAFSDSSNAGSGHFKSYGSLQPKSGEVDGDTFGNIVFHDESNAAHGTFTSSGGTVATGDGGNTQFYDNTSAANGTYINYGAVTESANGGDAVFDGNSDGGNGTFHNYAATAKGGYGGVVSFNNNPPDVNFGGSSAGHGVYHNYGATNQNHGGGGHIEFSAVHGSPTADHGTFHNYGSVLGDSSSAGHTIFSINIPTDYFPSAGNGSFWNHPAPVANGAGGYTEFAVYKKGADEHHITPPNADQATFHNLGGTMEGAEGGYTVFSGTCVASHATFIAYGGTNGGGGGRITFKDYAEGDYANVQLNGNGALDISDYSGDTLSIGSLSSNEGTIVVQTGEDLTTLNLSLLLSITSGTSLKFSFPASGGNFEYNKKYTLLTAYNLSDYDRTLFQWDSDEVHAHFEIEGNDLTVYFS